MVALVWAAYAPVAPPFVQEFAALSYGQAAPMIPWIALGYGSLGP